MSHVSGPNTAYERLKRSGENSTSRSSGIMYPSGTNDRGSGGREHHASGDTVGGIVTKNRAHAIAQIRNETGRAKHAAGDKVKTKQESHLRGGGIGHKFGHMGRDLNRSLSLRSEKMGKEERAYGGGIGSKKSTAVMPKRRCYSEGEEVESHKFGAGIGKDFRDLGKKIKHGFDEKIKKPSKHGIDVAGKNIRKTADFVGDKAKEGYKAASKTAQKAGRSIRKDWEESGR